MDALAACAAFSIIARTASTSVSLAASQPDNSQTICVPSAFNFFLVSSGAFGWENPTSRRVVQRVRYTVSLSTFQQTLAGAASFGPNGRSTAMARWARRPPRTAATHVHNEHGVDEVRRLWYPPGGPL